jgi:hypothetical protein
MPPALELERQTTLATYSARVSDLHDLMFNALEAIIELDQLLNQFQPIYSGRLRVMWFSFKASAKHYPYEREPLMVQWNYSYHASRWRAKRVPLSGLLRFQNTTDAFAHHAASTRLVLENLRSLILLYHRARRLLTPLQSIPGDWQNKGMSLIEQTQAQTRKFVLELDRQTMSSAPL